MLPFARDESEDAMIIQMYDNIVNSNKDDPLLLNKADVRYLYCDAWNRACSVSGKKSGKMSLVPWKPHKGLKPWNLVLVDKKHARAFPVEMDTSEITNTLKNVKAHYSRNWKCLKGRHTETESSSSSSSSSGSNTESSSHDSSFAQESEESEDECYDSETPAQSSDSQDQQCAPDQDKDDTEIIILESSDDSLSSSSSDEE